MNENNEYKKNNIPDVYADRVNLSINAFGVTLTWGLSQPKSDGQQEGELPSSEIVAKTRTSLTHAKVLALLLIKNIRKFEKDNEIKIQIPNEILERLEIRDLES
jgi:hypothetical protein